ncbi:hypothetical protein Dvina_30970 [Dactylosporangium vinaceum]|uniref:Uncharacterized protein n=1 Tax=Dactylosporangium vinaceum TaxID=53362 RepID=A0ABV5MJZ9_9ACTN|nr:hypothetical protein [Dactylosporangium vinaceum]UAB92740.1 hypothetical protein Dvina_30970 [Dactylosporangium vinaceum]
MGGLHRPGAAVHSEHRRGLPDLGARPVRRHQGSTYGWFNPAGNLVVDSRFAVARHTAGR